MHDARVVKLLWAASNTTEIYKVEDVDGQKQKSQQCIEHKLTRCNDLNNCNWSFTSGMFKDGKAETVASTLT